MIIGTSVSTDWNQELPNTIQRGYVWRKLRGSFWFLQPNLFH
jgi:hypothetical protein